MSLHEGRRESWSSRDDEEFESLPFAINDYEPTTTERKPLHVQIEEAKLPLYSVNYDRTAVVQSPDLPLAQSTLSHPPALMSDSTSMASSITSDVAGSSSHWGGDTTALLSSRQIDAAASLMASMAGDGLHMTLSPPESHSLLPESQTLPIHTNTQPESHFSRLGFSRLLQNAGDASEMMGGASLPVLHEEETDSFYSAREGPSFPSNISSTTSQIMTPTTDGWIPVDNPGYNPPILESAVESVEKPQHQLFPTRERGVSARQLDPTSFEVSIEIAPDLSVEEVMEVLGNPSYLILWCESIRSLVILNSSEGVNAQRTNGEAQRRAQHEAEWIEATTTDLVSPPSSSSCFYSTSKAVWNYVGFPSHFGNVSMFVERPNGRLSLSLGPFAGDVTVSHSIRVEKLAASTRIVDRVTLSRDAAPPDFLLCGVMDCLESCFLPTVKGYMDQAVASMIRLRTLVETGEGGSQQEGFELIHSRRQAATAY